jgi:nitrite reductase/ring-hydroxylating ferredoxin subunit
MNLLGAQHGRRIGGEIGVAGPGGEDHHAPLFQVPQGAPQDIGFGHLVHGDGGLHAGLDACPFQGVLQCQAVDDRCQHAHVVGGGPFHAQGAGLDPAEDIAAADHNGDFNAQFDDGPP